MQALPENSFGPDGRLTVGAVLLAAGAASRMGHRPKALLQLDGVPLVQRQWMALLEAGVDQLVVVLGHHAEHIEPLLRDFPISVIHNPRPNDGQVSSQRQGLAALVGRIDAVLVALADQPLIGVKDISDLMAAWKQRPTGTQVVQPAVDGMPGNPVMFSDAVRMAILAGDASMCCRHWQAEHPDQVYRWVTSNSRYRTDVDTPEDIESLAERIGRRLEWPEHLNLDALANARDMKPAVARQ